MNQITIKIPLIPRAQKRARSRAIKSKTGKWIAMTYKSKQQDLEEQKFIAFLFDKRPDKLIEGPIKLSVVASLPIPKSKSKKWKELALSGGIRPTGKPDLDNLIKHVTDCLNGLYWKDDSQIVEYFDTGKQYSLEPGWIISIHYKEG